MVSAHLEYACRNADQYEVFKEYKSSRSIVFAYIFYVHQRGIGAVVYVGYSP